MMPDDFGRAIDAASSAGFVLVVGSSLTVSPANSIALLLLFIAIVGLVMQPDFGQTMLIALVWGVLFFFAGIRLVWVAGLAGIATIGIGAAYLLIPHVARRIERFLSPPPR